MRVLDILTESFLTEGPLERDDFNKEPYRLQNFIKKLELQEPFYTTKGDPVVIPATKKEIAALKTELNTKFDLSDPKKRALKKVDMPSVIGGVRLTSLQKTKEFGGTISISATGETDVSKANLGPTVEALKSFAIYAKLVFRGKDKITPEDVLKIGKLADQHSKVAPAGKSDTPTTLAVYSRKVPDINGDVKDDITLKVALSPQSFQRAVRTTPTDKEAWGNLQGIVKYVNEESDMGKYTKLFATNNKRDPLKISVVGIGGAKTDIESTYTTPQGEEKPIQNLNMSIKAAGAEWYDQASANNLEGMVKFYSIMGLDEELAEQAIIVANFKEGQKGSTEKEFETRTKAAGLIYEVAYNQLKARIARLNDKGEADYIHTFLGNLKNSLAGDQKLVYVKFNAKGTYDKLKPHLLLKLADVMELDVNFTDTGRPTIYWIDKKTGKTLIYVVLLRVPSQKRLTHQFNLGKDFFELLRDAEQTPGIDNEVDNADLLPKADQANSMKQANKEVKQDNKVAKQPVGKHHPSMAHPAQTPAVKRAVRSTAPAPAPIPAVQQTATPAAYPTPPAYNPAVEV